MENLTARIIGLRITLLIGLGALALLLFHKEMLSIPLASVIILMGIGIYILAAKWLAAAASYRTEFWYKFDPTQTNHAGLTRADTKKQIANARQKLDELERRFAGALSDTYDIYSFARARNALTEIDSLTPPGLKLGYFGHLFYKKEVETFIDLLEIDLPLATVDLQNASIVIPTDPQKRYQKLQKFFYSYLESPMDEPETRQGRSEVLTKGYLKLTA